MILQALYEYYQRNREKLPPKGFQTKQIKFVIRIDRDGVFRNLEDKREGNKGKEYLLPREKGRCGSNAYQIANLLWDHHGYVLAHPKDETEKARAMALKQHKTFVDLLGELPDKVKADAGVVAVLKFYAKGEWKRVKLHANWPDCAKVAGCNMSFQLEGEDELVPESEIVRNHQASLTTDESEEEGDVGSHEVIIGRCLITGEKGPVMRLHAPTPILGSRPNAKIPGFQKNSGFDSYGKEQAYNAPVSSDAEAAYTTALKFLTISGTNRVLVGDMTVVFWAQKKNEEFDLESDFVWYFKSDRDDPDKGIAAVKALYQAVDSGRLPLDEDNQFYVLGLAPNVARISVRFWKTGTVSDFARRIKQHFEDFKIVHGPKEHEHLSLYQILSATALEYKMDNVPPNLAGDVIVSILDGTPYPRTLLQQCIRRIRAEQQVNRARAAIVKACINRFNRFYNKREKEVLVGLDRTNTNTGYRIGRLFAVLEKIQEEASPGINATIRDRFYGAASATPITVFPQLLKLKNHHLPKIPNLGRRVNLEKEIQEIFESINIFPSHLALDEQALFAVGYYHQRQDFFTKKDTENK